MLFEFLNPGSRCVQWGTVIKLGETVVTRHNLLHFALSAVYMLIAAILLAEAAYPHSACAAIAAIVYGLIAWPTRKGKS
jgi:hypothetical protein